MNLVLFNRNDKRIVNSFDVEIFLRLNEFSCFLLLINPANQNNVLVNLHPLTRSKYHLTVVKADDVVYRMVEFLHFLMVGTTLVWCSRFNKLWHLLEYLHLPPVSEVVDDLLAAFEKLHIKLSLLKIPFSCGLLKFRLTPHHSWFASSLLDRPPTIVFFDREIRIVFKLSFEHA